MRSLFLLKKNMRGLIKGLFLVCFLITTTSQVCGGSPIDESGNVSNKTSVDSAPSNDSVAGSHLEPISVPADNVGGSKDTPNGQRSSRCPPANHTLQLNEQTANNHGNETDTPLVKEEGHETAFGKLSESISGVLSTLKKSVQSIFSPGTGLAQEEKDMNCSLPLVPNNSTGSGEHADDAVGDKLGENGLLIPPVSSNDTNNSTNTSTTSPTTTSTPATESSSEETNSAE